MALALCSERSETASMLAASGWLTFRKFAEG
jgi:hypothetical protein